MKKSLSVLFIILNLFTSIFAHDGMMSGEKDIRVSSTKWFDIIYPERCQVAAQILYKNADSIYEELGKEYGYPPIYRMPVIICPAVESFNGYWTNGPYNHIVLYDTSMIEDLSVFSETFISTFRHECTHAYTYNMKNEEWQILSKIFGESFSIIGLFVSSGMAEGATVTSESSFGEGRLNDEYSLQMLKQAYIEGKFPDYWDVQGSSNIYPAGSFYYFNAAFHQWLQKNYGMKKYGEFWYKCINAECISTGRAFKKTYGIKIKKAWEEFTKALPSDINIPSINANPIKNGSSVDFFVSPTANYSPRNNEGSLFENLCVSERGLYYLDKTCSRIFFVPSEELNDENISPKQLLLRSGINNLSFNVSKDGRFVVVNYFEDKTPTIRALHLIFDVDTNKTFYLSDHGFYHPSIIQKDGEYFLVRQGYTSPNYSIKVDKIDLNSQNGQINGISDYSSINFELNSAPFSFTDLQDGTFAYILKDGLNYSICINDLQGNLINKIEAPKNRMVIRELSTSDGKNLYFSWAAPGTMPRLGKLNINDGYFEFQTEDVSGGVYNPVFVSPKSKNNVAYIGQFYRQNRLFFMTEVAMEKENLQVVSEIAEIDGDGSDYELQAPGDELQELPYNPYKPFKYFTKGYLLPASNLTTNTYMSGYTTSYALPFGLTYTTSNPWDSDSIILSAGWGPETNSFKFDINYSGGANTSLYTYKLEASGEVDSHGWKKTTFFGDFYSQYPFGKRNYFYGEVQSDFNLGHRDIVIPSNSNLYPFGAAQSTDLTNYLHWNNGFRLGFTNILKHGPGRYESSGINVSVILANTYFTNATTSDLISNNCELQLLGLINIPKLIPIRNKYGFTYNLPSMLHFHVFPTSISSEFDSTYDWMIDVYNTSSALASARLDTLLFATDVQKASDFLSALFYIHNIELSASYAGMLVDSENSNSSWRFTKTPQYIEKAKNGKLLYEDYAGIRLCIDWNLNFGALASSNSLTSLYVEYGYAGILGNHTREKMIFTLGFTSLF